MTDPEIITGNSAWYPWVEWSGNGWKGTALLELGGDARRVYEVILSARRSH
jgi:hypothetical protein